MMKDGIKIQIILIILLSIFLILPYKRYINKRVYDPEANYQVLKKINRSKIEMENNILIVYDKNFKADFYNLNIKSRPIKNLNIKSVSIKNLDKIIYLENYEKDPLIQEDGYFSYVFSSKDNENFYFRGEWMKKISVKNYREAIDENFYLNSSLYQKKVKPFIPYFQTPKEFYNNFKEYFFPYYLGEYELK